VGGLWPLAGSLRGRMWHQSENAARMAARAVSRAATGWPRSHPATVRGILVDAIGKLQAVLACVDAEATIDGQQADGVVAPARLHPGLPRHAAWPRRYDMSRRRPGWPPTPSNRQATKLADGRRRTVPKLGRESAASTGIPKITSLRWWGRARSLRSLRLAPCHAPMSTVARHEAAAGARGRGVVAAGARRPPRLAGRDYPPLEVSSSGRQRAGHARCARSAAA